ncbi:PE domain-containing protein [Sciscionella sediminilitoris]|uniref:PE domain-containing protein n=1 Tax=Sciscionella sediminilitoris TaxID=1445613 RepID=UPI0004DFC27F|nr:PE domain-containing protein [Sciscionella sp. SE31]
MDGYGFKPEEFPLLFAQWTEVLDQLKRKQDAITTVMGTAPPAQDEASVHFTQRVRDSGFALLEANRKMQEFVKAYITNLVETARQYHVQEAESVDLLRLFA